MTLFNRITQTTSHFMLNFCAQFLSNCSWYEVCPSVVGECLQLTHGLEQRRLSLLRDLVLLNLTSTRLPSSSMPRQIATCPSLGHRFHRQTKSCQLFPCVSLAIAQQYFAKAFFPIAYCFMRELKSSQKNSAISLKLSL